MKLRYILLFFALLCIVANQTFAIQLPILQGRVNDHANILSAETRQELETRLQKQEDTTTNQIVLLTVSSLEGQPIEMFANEVFNTWKLGKAGKNNGVLLLIAVNDHQMRIEVGYGLEHALTDALSNRIIRNELTPFFKEEQYEKGIEAGINAIVGAVNGTYT